MGAAMRYQPQGLARLNRNNPLLTGALAVISAAQPVNLVSLVPLKNAGTVTQGLSLNGKVFQFRKNGYVETEKLPAIGTASFVEFWCGVPSADRYALGAASQPGFLTGSSANQIGIIGSVGSNQSTANPGQWGAVRDWGNNDKPATGEVLAAGVPAVLVVVRRQTGMEFWHNGVLVYTYPSTPLSYSAQSMICGSFVEDTGYWPSSSDTMLAGRIGSEWTADQVRQFSANPWQLFDAGSSSSAYQAAIASASASSGGVVATNTPVNPASASLGLTGYAPTVIRGASVAVGLAAGSLSIAGYAPAVTQSTTTSVRPGVGSFSITGYAPSITQSINASIAPGSAGLALTGYAPTVARTASQSQTPQPGALTITGYAPTVVRSFNQSIVVPASAGSVTMLALTGYAPSISQGLNVVPQYYDATIMQLSAVRGTANLGPDRIQQTVDLV